MNVTLNNELDTAIAEMVANFNEKDKAPEGLVGINFSGFGVSVLFNNKATVISEAAKISKEEPELDVTVKSHGYIIRIDYSKICAKDPQSSPAAVYNLHEMIARTLAHVNGVELLGWVDIHSKANDMWFHSK